MQKIMFNDKYGLTDAVLKGEKTMTRRFVPTKDAKRLESFFDSDDWDYAKQTCIDDSAAYMIGETIAVAQAYKNVFHPLDWVNKEIHEREKGWNNKMFVRADLMPHQIRITDIKIERLQDISDEDCLKEGIYVSDTFTKYGIHNGYSPQCANDPKEKKWWFNSPIEAFATLIDKVSGKGTWERNPWIFAYEFELVK